jgi:hypothetical protein
MSAARNYLLIGLLLMAFCIAAVSLPKARASPEIILEIVPSTTSVDRNEQFYANVTLSGATAEHDLVGIEFQIKWNTTVLTGIKMELPEGHIFQEADDYGNMWKVKTAMNDSVHPNTAWYFVTVSDLESGYNDGYLPIIGSGIICKLTFNATSTLGDSALYFSEMAPTYVKAKLSNGDGVQITDYTTVDSAVSVVPEFPSSMVYVMLLTLSLMVAVISKKFPKSKLKTI